MQKEMLIMDQTTRMQQEDYIAQKRARSSSKKQAFKEKMHELEKLNLTREELISEMKKEFGKHFSEDEINNLLK